MIWTRVLVQILLFAVLIINTKAIRTNVKACEAKRLLEYTKQAFSACKSNANQVCSSKQCKDAVVFLETYYTTQCQDFSFAKMAYRMAKPFFTNLLKCKESSHSSNPSHEQNQQNLDQNQLQTLSQNQQTHEQSQESYLTNCWKYSKYDCDDGKGTWKEAEQCCVPKSCKSDQGMCVPSSSCSAQSGKTESGLCPGGSSLLCCHSFNAVSKVKKSSGSNNHGSNGGTINQGGNTGGKSKCPLYSAETSFKMKGNSNKVFDVYKILSAHKKHANIGDNVIEVGTACAYEQMRDAAEKAIGKSILISSGFRTYQRQQYFYDLYACDPSKKYRKSGTYCVVDPKGTIQGGRITVKGKRKCACGPLAARPGTSKHGVGVALDLTTNEDSGYKAEYQWMIKNAHTYGFIRTVLSEKWHWEYQGKMPVSKSIAPFSY